jgi:trans-2,3-dihydro-3-hydroxyanthranilate isomerase
LELDYPFATVDVFTDRRFGGNPLAVFYDAAGLSDSDMQALAAEMNLSETTFVLPPSNKRNSAQVRIFNRTEEMEFAGHPNVGTAFVLAQLGPVPSETLWFEENAGVIAVRLIRNRKIVVGAELDAPQTLMIMGEFQRTDIAECVGLRPNEIGQNHPPLSASVGTPFVVCEVSSEALRKAVPDHRAFRAMIDNTPDLNGQFSLLLYAVTASGVRSRMFAPVAGTWEDPATGSAHAALAALRLSLHADRDLANLAYEALQGVEMGRASYLFVRAWRAADGVHASVAGRCAPVFRGTLSDVI